MFEMMVRRFSQEIDAGHHHYLSPISRWPTRTAFTDGRECRACRTFYPA